MALGGLGSDVIGIFVFPSHISLLFHCLPCLALSSLLLVLRALCSVLRRVRLGWLLVRLCKWLVGLALGVSVVVIWRALQVVLSPGCSLRTLYYPSACSRQHQSRDTQSCEPTLLTSAYASSAEKLNATDPTLTQAQSLLEEGTRALEDNDMSRARNLYTESLSVAPTSGAWFNLGVVEYQLSEFSSDHPQKIPLASLLY